MSDPIARSLMEAITSGQKCPACGGSMKNATYVCSRCWWEVPAKDRQSLRGLHVRRLPTESKVAKILRNLKAKREAANLAARTAP